MVNAGRCLIFWFDYLLQSHFSHFLCLSLFLSLSFSLQSSPPSSLSFSQAHNDNNSHTLCVSLMYLIDINFHIINNQHFLFHQAIQSCPLSSLNNRNRSTVFNPKKKNVKNIPNVLLYVTSDNFGKVAHLPHIMLYIVSCHVMPCHAMFFAKVFLNFI